MLGLSSSQQYFFDMNLSPIRTSPPPLSPPHHITTSPVSQPPHVNSSSTSMTLPHKEFFSTSDYFTSLTFTSTSSPMNIPPLGIQIPLKQTQMDPLVTVQHQTTSSSEVMVDFWEDTMVSMGKYYWRKRDKVVLKRGFKRARESSSKQVPSHH